MSLRDSLAGSFWFVPAVMAFLAAFLALASVAVDHSVGSGWVENWGWVWSGEAEGARSVLSVVAGSLMTVISIVFTLTISLLAQTSAHFGSGVLRYFTSDRKVQFTLGTFISTFVYCLLVLRTVRSVEETSFVPYLAVNIGIFLALASMAVLIFFIHHIAQSIQAENLIARVGQGFQVTLPLLFPDRIGEEGEEVDLPEENFWRHAVAIPCDGTGYLQRVDDGHLMRLAQEHDLQIRLKKRPGEFVSPGDILLEARPASHLPEQVQARLAGCFVVANRRTPHQDALFSFQQLVEIATRALSPGINEPNTALTCIDWLGACLRGVAKRQLPSRIRMDSEGNLRVVACSFSFEELVAECFDSIRLYGSSDPAILTKLARVIASLSSDVHEEGRRQILREQIQLLKLDAGNIVNQGDRERILGVLQGALLLLSSADIAHAP